MPMLSFMSFSTEVPCFLPLAWLGRFVCGLVGRLIGLFITPSIPQSIYPRFYLYAQHFKVWAQVKILTIRVNYWFCRLVGGEWRGEQTVDPAERIKDRGPRRSQDPGERRRGRSTEDRRQRTEDRGWRRENGG